MKVGLVLGAGGVVGGAWLTGGLHALATETGWDPAEADYLVGTSAGSMIGALCASGVPPWFMVAHSRGETFDEVVDAHGRPAADADRAAGAVFNVQPGLSSLGPGSWRLALRSLSRPNHHTPAAALSGWLPRGMVSTDPLKAQVRRVVPTGWSPHPNLWIVACDYATGERVAFGRDAAPPAELADAVAASCAIPGFYQPVTIAGRPYVDGGIYSTSNLDILLELDLDVAICLNPTSTLHPFRALNPREWPNFFLRRASGRRLGSEAKRVRAEGTEVVLVQPTGDDLAVMGPNLMSTRRRNEVIAVATRTVAEQLRAPEVRELLAELPKGAPEKVHRPDERPSRWPKLRDLSERIRRRSRATSPAS
ncbi:MAG: patatin-like phospholipase family protein [Solirubrobacterales bacterium]